MDAVHVNVPLRTGKKMKKRKELDALVANSVTKRTCGTVVGSVAGKRNMVAGNGINSQDQLLSESTDEQDHEYWQHTNSGTKRPRNGTRISRPRRILLSLVRACTALLVFSCVVATVTVMWLLIDVREQVTSLRSELDQVVASNQGVPEALQKCHSLSRALHQNQSVLATQLNNLHQQLENFTQQVSGIKNGLAQVEERLKTNPELVNVPRDLNALSNSVAQFGSQIRDLVTTVASLKEQSSRIEVSSNTLGQDVTQLKEKVTSIQNSTQSTNQTTQVNDQKALLNMISQMSNNVSILNETLSKKIQWSVEDQSKDHKLIEGLQEMNQSVIARVTTLEDSCNKRTKEQEILLSNVSNLSDQITLTSEKTKALETQIITLQSQYHDLNENDTQLKLIINEIRQNVPTNAQTSVADMGHLERAVSQSMEERNSNPSTVTQVTSTVTQSTMIQPIIPVNQTKPITLSAT